MIGDNVNRGKGLVLVADCDASVRLQLRKVLEQRGFIVEEADNGANVMSAFERLGPDIVMIDVMLPDIDAFTLYNRMRSLSGDNAIPVLIMVGQDDADSIMRGYEAGITDFITKPINLTILSYRMLYMLRTNKAFSSLYKSEARLVRVQSIAHVGNWEWDVQADKFYCSEEFYRIFGIDPLSFDGKYLSLLNFVHPADREFVNTSIEEALNEKKLYSIDHRVLLPDGTERTVYAKGEVIVNGSGAANWMVGTVQDITDRKQTEDQIRYLAYFDGLTGLPNRTFFKEHLERAIVYATRHKKMIALLFLDMDRFKNINATLGHDAGDKLLKNMADRLKTSVRKTDSICHEGHELVGTVSRLGGDEFTILLTDIVQIQDVSRVALRVLELISKPFSLDGHEIVITASIGISIYPNDSTDIVHLIKDADTAMYRAKDLGKNNFQFYTQSMNAKAFELLVMEGQLHKALEREEFFLHYQPQVDIRTGRIVGVEALVRWQHPKLGMVSPASFIPLAEETGLIIPIDEWVLKTACSQNKKWQTAGFPPVKVSINLSAKHFARINLMETIAKIVRDTGMDPHYLDLEITEGVLIRNVKELITIFQELKGIGVSLLIDDFGTGYSSLSYLKKFPLDVLKIDQSFVREITTDSGSAAITKTIIEMAHNLHLRALAEGVETEAQFTFLLENGCDVFQGYLFSKPQPAEEVARFLQNGKSL